MVNKNTLQYKLNRGLKGFSSSPAIVYGNKVLTYGELDKRSNHIANRLIDRGIRKETSIGVLIDDKMELITAMIGILKAGCVFVPLECAHPKNRLEIMIHSAGITLVITDNFNLARFVPGSGDGCIERPPVEFIPIGHLLPGDKSAWIIRNPDVRYSGEDKVYIYFTSGTTGTPKAMIGKNRSLLHFIDWEIDTFQIDETFRVSQFSSAGFDAFLRDILVPLCSGGVICIPGSRDTLLNPGDLANWIDRRGIHLIHCVPAIFRLFNSHGLTGDNFKDLKFILLSGEKVEPGDFGNWFDIFAQRIQVVNLWGTSETTMAKTYYFISRGDLKRERIPVGKPLKGARVVILDENLAICKKRTVGELYIRTPYRTFGYCNDPELTMERFVTNPFNNDPDDLLHKTGDLGRLLPDGNLEVLGRNDRQVKVQGIRIELEEIENVLVKHPAVQEAAVIKKEIANNNTVLCAYVSGKEKSENETGDQLLIPGLKTYLSGELPSYMVPAGIVKIEKIPRTINGKVDYKKLSTFAGGGKSSYISPRGEVEKKLSDLWSVILGIQRISVTKRFFELGGSSINIMSLISKIHREFDIRISLAEIFNNPTIEMQAAIIKRAVKDKYISIEEAEEKDYYALSSAQKRLYILQQMNKGNVGYNMPKILEIKGYVEKDRLEGVFSKLIKRYESFRTSFQLLEDEPVQKIHEQVNFDIEYYGTLKDFIRPFDLSRVPLLRVGLIKIEEKRCILVVDMHHIISDAVSIGLMVRDFQSLFAGEELSPLRLQYKDYSEWQGRVRSGELNRVKEQEVYWLKTFEGEIPVLNMPTDCERPPAMNFKGDRIHFDLGGELSRRLYQLVKETDTTLYIVLLAVFNVLLFKYTGDEDIVVGSPITGRTHPDLENIIGMFVNMLAMRNRPTSNRTFRDFLGQVKENALGAYQNQDYQFDQLVNTLNIQVDPGRNPLFNVVFELQNVNTGNSEEENVKRLDNLEIVPIEAEHKISIFDLLLGAVEFKNEISMNLEYSTELFNESTAEKITVHFVHVLRGAIFNIDKRLSGIEMLSDREKEELIYGYNDKTADYPKDKTVCQLFEARAEKFPGNIAVTFENRQLSYKELNEKANRLARVLIRKGIKRDEIAALMLEHSLGMITAVLGILKAGGAYLAVDPEYPAARKKFMMEDSGTRLLLTQEHLVDKNKEWLKFFPLNDLLIVHDRGILDEDPSKPGVIDKPGDLIYILYTSGTSGTPKGVMIEHQGVVNYVWWAAKTYVKNEGANFPLYTSLSFDLTVTSIFTPLITANAIIIYGGEYKELLIEKIIEENRVDVIKLTPSHLKLIKHKNPVWSRIKRLIVGGEALETKLAGEISKLFNDNIEIYNEYGPTETVVGCMIYRFNPGGDKRQFVPIGSSVDNVRNYILDKNKQPAAQGVTGAIYISGDGVARGYLNRPGLTRERFVTNPFIAGKRMYKSGDLGLRLRDGNIEFIGRRDQQVKIKGFRVELAEIEKKLEKFETAVNPGDHLNKNIIYCTRCLLTANYPGIHFDEDGVCSICREFDGYRKHAEKYFKKRDGFLTLFENIKKSNRGQYDCLLLFSGGKDSSYVLYQLIEMGLKVLTFTFDNGYISEAAFANIKKITSGLRVDHLVAKADNMNKAFVESLKSEYNVCRGCWNVLNTVGAKIALEKGIDMVVSGLSRGQIFDMRLHGLFQAGVFTEAEIEERLLLFRKSFHSSNNKFSRILDIGLEADSVAQMHFVDFFRYDDTPVKEIKAYLQKKGWVKPGDTGLCSSNCMINDVGIYMHLRHKGYHFYEAPLSWDYRLGVITREEGLKELQLESEPENVDKILAEIGYYHSSSVEDAVVIAREDRNGDKYLCAYLVSGHEPDTAQLKTYLAEQLPHYMIPRYFVTLKELPLTANGKLDTGALPEPGETTVGSHVEYAAPGNAVEEKLLQIWREVLAIKNIGVNENFFEIGGDSIKSIQVASRLLKHKLQLEIRDLFFNPTIKRVAKYVKKMDRVIHQGIVEGEVELTPVQKWFFEHNFTHPHHFNQTVMLHRKSGFDETRVKKVFTEIVKHHDALRMVFKRDGKPKQLNRGLEENLFDLEVIDLEDKTGIEVEIEREAQRVQEGIDLEKGPLVKLGLFKTNRGDHLLAAIHHLVVDGVSWRIILEDFSIGYGQVENGVDIRFQEKTDSFQYWAHRLAEYAESKEVLKEGEYWKTIEETGIETLPADKRPGIENKKHKNCETIRLTFDEEETGKLLKRVNRAYNTDINDILLTALGMAIKEWAGTGKVLINLEAHGREPIIESIDINRTVGWFTSQYPVVLDMSRWQNLSYMIKFVKETIRRIPNHGIGYGILRYLTAKERKKGLNFGLEPKIRFNYLGQFGQENDNTGGGIEISAMKPGNSISPELEQPYALDINGILLGEKLSLAFSYNKYEYNRITIEKLVDYYKVNLIKIIRHCFKKEKKELTPYDVGNTKISIEDLVKIENLIGKDFEIQLIYPLTAMQRGVLFQSLLDKVSNPYFEQGVFSIEGEIDTALFEKSLNILIHRHDVLRTFFVHEKLDEPLQVVVKKRDVKIHFKDISHLQADRKEQYLEDFKIKDRERGLDLSKDHPMRIHIFKKEEHRFCLVWGFHHIVLDGWCLGIIYQELIRVYQALKQGKSMELEPVTPYIKYVEWLEKQDKEEGLRYWREYLAGCEKQAALPRFGGPVKDNEYKREEYNFSIDEALTDGLYKIAKENQVTVNTIFQTIWGLLLQNYNNTDDAVFGTVVSGRPSEINGIERMLGLFINTVPVRIRREGDREFSQLLKDVHRGEVLSRSHEYFPLADIEASSLLKRDLIGSLVIFENFPVQEVFKDSRGNEGPGFAVKEVKIREHTNFDFIIAIIPGRTMSIKCRFNSLVYNKYLVRKVALNFSNVVKQVVQHPGMEVSEIKITSDEKRKEITAQLYENLEDELYN